MKKLHSFTYIGGKFFLVAFLMAMIPTHTTYCEGFGGSGSFLLNKPQSKSEVYNDINSDVVNFFRVLRNEPDALIERLKLTPYAREEFVMCKTNIPFEKWDVEKARKFFVKHQQSHSGRGGDFGFGVMKSQAVTFKNKVDKLKAIAERLRGVTIENRDYKFILEHYCKNEDVFAYLDPPYLHSTRVSTDDYAYEMTEAQHREMLDLCLASPAKILISGYPSKLYESKLKKWHRKEIDVALSCSTGKEKKPRRTEVFWWNYQMPKA